MSCELNEDVAQGDEPDREREYVDACMEFVEITAEKTALAAVKRELEESLEQQVNRCFDKCQLRLISSICL